MRGIPGGDIDPVANFWLVVFIVAFGVILFVIHKLSNGFIFAYSKAKVNKHLVQFLRYAHFAGAGIPAFMLPNNYLVEFKTFERLFRQNGIWIGISITVIFIMLMILIGILFTLLLKRANGN